MKPEIEAKVKYGVWGLIVGAALAMIIGFWWGGRTTAGKTKTISKKAVLASQSAICVAQFMQDPNHTENLKKLEELNSWIRSDFIEKGGWDKIPGQNEGNYIISRAFAEGLELLMKE